MEVTAKYVCIKHNCTSLDNTKKLSGRTIVIDGLLVSISCLEPTAVANIITGSRFPTCRTSRISDLIFDGFCDSFYMITPKMLFSAIGE